MSILLARKITPVLTLFWYKKKKNKFCFRCKMQMQILKTRTKIDQERVKII